MEKQDKKLSYYERNKEKVKARVLKRYKEKKDEILEKQKDYIKQYRKENKQKIKKHQKEYQKEYRLKNQELIKQKRDAKKEENSRKLKENYKQNKEYYYNRYKKYYENNKSDYVARCRKRQLKKKEATPENANEKLIRVFYEMASRLSKCTGIPFDVDHLTPIEAGGLHHEENLLPVPASVNRRKHTKTDLRHPFYNHLKL